MTLETVQILASTVVKKALTGILKSQRELVDALEKTGVPCPFVGTVLVEHDILEKLAVIETLRTCWICTTMEKMVETSWEPKKATEGTVTLIEMAAHSDRADALHGESIWSYPPPRDPSNWRH